MKKTVISLLTFSLMLILCIPAAQSTESASGQCKKACNVTSCKANTSLSKTVNSADGVEIAYKVIGKGSPALVFVHGWSCDSSYWQDQIEHFAARHRVVTIDLGGHGKSGINRTDWTMPAFGADVKAVLDELNLKSAILIGHSMGGAVITEAALATPDRVLGIIGIDNFQELALAISDEQIAGFTSSLTSNFQATCQMWIPSMFQADADTTLKQTIIDDMSAAPVEVGVSAMQELLVWYREQAAGQLEKLQVPLMCINADQAPTNKEQLLSVVPRYQLRLMLGHGHFLMREDPQEFNKLLTETVYAIAPK